MKGLNVKAILAAIVALEVLCVPFRALASDTTLMPGNLAYLNQAQTFTAAQTFGTNLNGTLQTAAQPNITSTGILASPQMTTATVNSGGLTVTAGNVGFGGAPNTYAALSTLGSTLTASGGEAYGLYTASTYPSGATSAADAIRSSVTTAAAAYTVTNARGLHITDATKGSGSAITTNSGIVVEAMTAGATNNFGIDIVAPSGGATANIGLRNAGTTTLSDSVQLGTPTGGAKGAGTINTAAGHYQNGVQLTGQMTVGDSGLLTLSQATTYYCGEVGCSTTEANVQYPNAVATTYQKMYVKLSGNVGGSGQTVIITARDGGSAQSLTCTINTGASTCNDTSNTFAAAAGDLMSFSVVTSATTGSFAQVSISFAR